MAKADIQLRRHSRDAVGEHAVRHRAVQQRRDYATVQHPGIALERRITSSLGVA